MKAASSTNLGRAIVVAILSCVAVIVTGCSTAKPWQEDLSEESLTSLTSSENPLTTLIECWCQDARGNVFESRFEVWPWQDVHAARRRCVDQLAQERAGVVCDRASE
jgi:hypothetical protein